MRIKQAGKSDLNDFFDYLNDHLSDNGVGNTALFQPLSRSKSKVTSGLMSRFEQGISTKFGKSGWRRLWLAVDNDGQIVGHIDIRSHPESNTTHRALLGMGVDRNSRNQGLGLSLLDEMFTFATSQTELEWIDLWVLSSNSAAKALYVKAGFELRGELPDMFRIDGVSQGYTLMTRRIDPNAA